MTTSMDALLKAATEEELQLARAELLLGADPFKSMSKADRGILVAVETELATRRSGSAR